MSDTAYLRWPFFEDRHPALARDLDAWAGQHVEALVGDEERLLIIVEAPLVFADCLACVGVHRGHDVAPSSTPSSRRMGAAFMKLGRAPTTRRIFKLRLRKDRPNADYTAPRSPPGGPPARM